MKKVISILFPMLFLALTFFSCQKTQETQIINTTDTVFLKDTIYLHDTIQQRDTLFIYDSIIFTDTIVMIDTIVIQDTSEFAYLFKHYELEQYEVLFYQIDMQKNSSRICKMFSDAHQMDQFGEGHYPIWAEDGDHIYYVNFSSLSINMKNIRDESIPDSIICPIDRNVMFLRHQIQDEVFLFSYRDMQNIPKLGAIDYHTGNVIELTEQGIEESNPACSEVDDWIYYCTRTNETLDIYRKKIDGSQVEAVYVDPDYNLSSYNVSADGKFLITPKYRDGKGLVVFYDIERHEIIHELYLPVDGHPMYASLSRDNRAIFFVNGNPYNYAEPRNIYRMGLDRTQLFQMTSFTDKLANRPLIK